MKLEVRTPVVPVPPNEYILTLSEAEAQVLLQIVNYSFLVTKPTYTKHASVEDELRKMYNVSPGRPNHWEILRERIFNTLYSDARLQHINYRGEEIKL